MRATVNAVIVHDPSVGFMASWIHPYGELRDIVDVRIVLLCPHSFKVLGLQSAVDLYHDAIFDGQPYRLAKRARAQVWDARVEHDGSLCRTLNRRYVCFNVG